MVYSKGGEICLNTLTITKQPSNFKGLLGDEIVFSVKAKGKGLTYQWQYTTDYGATWYNSTGSGYNTRILDGFPITLTRDGRFYRCKVTDADGNVAYSQEAEIVLVTQGWYFEYDANGMRTQRTDGDTTYRYVYNGSLLSQMTKGTDTLRFSYDAAGLPMTLTHNGTVYYYATNLQGDVIAILNTAGTAVAEYEYDVWGNPISTTGTMAQTLGKLNPLRYRGYVYDEETGLYYLQSRYYDPEVGRFINGDGQLNEGVLGNNQFTYCLNNPANQIDPQGTASYRNSYYVERKNGKVKNYIVTTVITIMRKKLTYKYSISAKGLIQFDFTQNTYLKLLLLGGERILAKAMYKQAKAINKKFLAGRTIGGVDTELQGHWAAYQITKHGRVAVADIGGLIKGNKNLTYDNNALIWESGNMIRIGYTMSPMSVWGTVRKIRSLLRLF